MGLTISEVFSGPFYSGSIENIERILRMIFIGGGRLSNVTDLDITVYQREIDRLMNDRLSPYYAVPLAKNADDLYPEPIPFIAARLVAADVAHNEFTEIEANESKAATTFKQNALAELDRLTMAVLAGSQKLEGQRELSRLRFARPTIVPLAAPPETGGGPMGGPMG